MRRSDWAQFLLVLLTSLLLFALTGLSMVNANELQRVERAAREFLEHSLFVFCATCAYLTIRSNYTKLFQKRGSRFPFYDPLIIGLRQKTSVVKRSIFGQMTSVKMRGRHFCVQPQLSLCRPIIRPEFIEILLAN